MDLQDNLDEGVTLQRKKNKFEKEKKRKKKQTRQLTLHENSPNKGYLLVESL